MSDAQVRSALQGNDYTWIECDPKDAKRIIAHLITRGTMFTTYRIEGMQTIIIPSSIDLQRLKEKLKGIDFTLV